MATLNHNELHGDVIHDVISKIHLYEQEDNKIYLSMTPANDVIRINYEREVFRTLNQLRPKYGISYTLVHDNSIEVVQLKLEEYIADTDVIKPEYYQICKDGVYWLNDPYFYISLCISDFFKEDSEFTEVDN